MTILATHRRSTVRRVALAVGVPVTMLLTACSAPGGGMPAQAGPAPSSSSTSSFHAMGADPTPTASVSVGIAAALDCGTVPVRLPEVAALTGLPVVTATKTPYGCSFVSTPDAGGRTSTVQEVSPPASGKDGLNAAFDAMGKTGMMACAWDDAAREQFTCISTKGQGYSGSSMTMAVQNGKTWQITTATNIPEHVAAAQSGSKPLAAAVRKRG
ncbi:MULTISPECIES: hypothetical protein [Arthrobacter]|uniref:DUF3558 domain-containing protein n=2 Tax=Arthrobacter TaxID=1663 RepID=A0ABU9KIY1_9MICC|nr:hypothetical protein [Arthrobacter sp. YJM1]MDP5226448.1 hypothetical protein [Arthrobacter sp. YJM1]